jgi:peroxiredoxin
MHNSRIIASVNPKFMINSQDVSFGITRQCAQVGVKNIIYLTGKSSRQLLQEWKRICLAKSTA